MKKEYIYKLIENGYKGGTDFSRFVSQFIVNLKDEGYVEMADVISNIKDNNSKPIFASAKSRRNSFAKFGKEISSEAMLIKPGFDHSIINSVFLSGKPGTGKTTFTKVLGKQMNLDVVELRLSSIYDSRFGETIKRFEAFMDANINTKQIIFIDEAEAIFSKRGAKNDVFENDRLLTIMLKKMDSKHKALIVLATNLKNNIDKAILRRFDMFLDFNNVRLDIQNEMLKQFDQYGLEIEEKEVLRYSGEIASLMKNPKFSELNFIAKRILLQKLNGDSEQKIIRNIDMLAKMLDDEKTKEFKAGK